MKQLIMLFFFVGPSVPMIVNNQPLSLGRAYFTATSMPLNGLAMFAGGRDAIKVSNIIDIYNIYTNSWSTASLTIPRQLLTATDLLESYAFFAGGCDFNCVVHYDRVDIFNVNTNKWTTSSLSVPRSSISSASLYNMGISFFVGGANQNGPSNVIDLFDGTQWATASLSIARFSIASTGISSLGLVFFAGGNDLNQAYPTIDFFDSGANSWGVLNMTFARTQCAATSLTDLGLVFFAGGRNSFNQDLDSIEILDVVNIRWYYDKLSTPRRDLVALSAPKSNTVYFAGGIQYYDGFIPRYISIVDYLNIGNKTQNYFPMPVGKAYAAGATFPVQDIVILAGGETGPNLFYLNQVNIYGGCKTGYYQSINPQQCVQCDAGYYCHFGETIPQLCPIGYYCLKGQTNIFPCPAGTYGPNTGAKDIGECVKCDAGTYNSQSGQSTVDSCLPCYPGSYCGSGSAFPKDCPNNNYCPDPSTMITCPAGTFRVSQYSQSVTDCEVCPPGSYCPGNGQYALPCNSGTYSQNNGSNVCEVCPSGHFCQFGAMTAQICPKDTIASKGSSACTPCELGQYTDGPGYSSCLVCLNSYWSVDNWWCQDRYQKLITVLIWIGTIISTIITIIKVRLFFRKRIKKLRMAKVPVTLKNIVFIERHITKQHSYFTSLISRIEEAQNEHIYRNTEEEIMGLKQTIMNLKQEIEDLK